MPDTARIIANLYNGARVPMPDSVEWMARISDGQPLNARKTCTVDGLQGFSKSFQVPFFDNLFDDYTVLVSAKGLQDTGWYPVHVNSAAPRTVALMALPENGQVRFGSATWDRLQVSRPALSTWFTEGCGSQVKDMYSAVLEGKPLELACLLNIATALADMKLSSKRTPLDYFWSLAWPAGDPDSPAWLNAVGNVLKQDRFFCYVEETFVDDVRDAADHGAFAVEPHPETFHPDATESYKQTQFDVANVQLTFHGRDTCDLTDKSGVTRKCVKIEPDIDYYKDLAAHGILEVLPNTLGHKLTDPRVAYCLRWMAGQQAGLPMFDPLFTVE